MIDNNLYRISEVANLTNVSRQTLIFYDKKNIVKPAYIDKNSYRYYSITQIHLIQIINMLKEFDIPLKTIKSYLDNRDKKQLLDLLSDIQGQMKEKIKRTKNYISVIDYQKSLIHKSMNLDNEDEIKLEMKKPVKVFLSTRLTSEEQDEGHFALVYQFEKKLNQLGLTGFDLNVIVEKEYINRQYDNHISYFCVDIGYMKKKIKAHTVPGGLYVTAYHKGRFQRSKETYMKILDYIEQNNLIIDGNSYETTISSFFTEADDADYLSEISIKVKEKCREEF